MTTPITEALTQLRSEREKIDHVISALENLALQSTKPDAGGVVGKPRKPRKPLTASAKARISAAMKKRWAIRKKKARKP